MTSNEKLMALVLICFAGTVWANDRQWEYAGTHPEQTAIKMYFDRASIRKEGKQVQIWSLLQKEGGESSIGHTEIECQTGQARSLEWKTYAGQMGSGKITNSNSKPGDWFYIGSSGLLVRLMQVGCR